MRCSRCTPVSSITPSGVSRRALCLRCIAPADEGEIAVRSEFGVLRLAGCDSRSRPSEFSLRLLPLSRLDDSVVLVTGVAEPDRTHRQHNPQERMKSWPRS